jgi:hypothetical protein
MNKTDPFSSFDPAKLARYEKDNYVAYYRKDWLTLLRASVGMVGEAYGLSFFQAVYAAYLVARAEIAFAPVPENDVPLAQAYIRRLFAFLNRTHGLHIPVEQAAEVEVYWWSVHRKLFAQAQDEELVEALVNAAAITYAVPADRLRQYAFHRAQGMLCSDLWVNGGKPEASPLLEREEAELAEGYTALREALQASARNPASGRSQVSESPR